MLSEALVVVPFHAASESIKRLQTANPGPQYDPTADKEKFSPTHFSKNIFAPYSDRTKFYVDYDPSREEDCLPEALRGPKQSNVKEYQEYLRTRGAEGFRGVVQQIERKPSDVKRIGVTWCLPKSVQPSAFPDTDSDELYDLLPNGRDLPVEVEFITVFLGMAHKYL
ncbi:GPI-anchored surface protein, putative [Bodo saltans]|uniref:GPI-anchored surface protein, putative n=1 Tax=Bodo saltans TaxID=75058 RepID=A0A0S4ILU8_BODSA|nr:GPI-anchored surface protein, putative [Bodo saltans]|eukprot:CUE72082.1 GPI-anchored surface protein, putative [Bodo saltans]